MLLGKCLKGEDLGRECHHAKGCGLQPDQRETGSLAQYRVGKKQRLLQGRRRCVKRMRALGWRRKGIQEGQSLSLRSFLFTLEISRYWGHCSCMVMGFLGSPGLGSPQIVIRSTLPSSVIATGNLFAAVCVTGHVLDLQ